MVRDDGKRNFALRENGEETSVYSGRTPRQAALKAARQLDASPSEAQADRTEIRLREKGKTKVHVYEAWAWREEAPEDAPDFLGDEVTSANVSKQGVDHTDDY